MTRPSISALGSMIWGLTFCAGIWACIGTFAGLFGSLHWTLDLAAHFRPQYFLLLLPLALVVAARRRFRWAAIFAFFALVNAAFVATVYLPGRANASDGKALRVLLANVHTTNSRYDAFLALAKDVDADIIFLQEVNQAWVDRVSDLNLRYPHVLLKPQDDNFGFALYSRIPWTDARVVFPGEGWVAAALATLDFDGKMLNILGIHAFPPSGREASRIRNDLLLAVSGTLADRPGSHLVVGDFNVTPWSPHFRRLLWNTGLRSSQRGFGIQATWPGPLPALFRIPIDHALVSPEIAVTRREVGPYIGSDHHPLILEIALP